jgi:hypothetical protein
MYRLSTELGATAPKKTVPVTVSTGPPSWKMFYDGAVYSTKPSERTVRFVNDYVAKTYKHIPETIEVNFGPYGEMTFIEVFAPKTSGPLASVALPFDMVSIPVELYAPAYGVVRKFNFKTKHLTEKSILYLNTWVRSRQHWGGTDLGYRFWDPTKVTLHLSPTTGRPKKISVRVQSGTEKAAGEAKYQFAQLYAKK